MNRIILTLVALVLLVITTFTQAHYEVSWLNQAPQEDGNFTSYVIPFRNDCNKTSYQCGTLKGADPIGFGDDQFVHGYEDHAIAFVAKYFDNGTVDWVRVLNTTGNSICTSIVIIEGGVAFGGAFEGNVTEWNGNEFTGSETGVRLGFVGVFNSDGSFGDFAVLGSTTSGDFSEVNGLSTDEEGTLYVVGTFNGTLSTGASEVTAVGGSDIFYVAYSTDNGVFHFANSTGGDGSEQVVDIATNADGLSCVIGTFESSVSFGGIHLSGSDEFDHSAFLFQLDSTGSIVFASAIYGDVVPHAVAINDVGHCTVVGSFNQTIYPATFEPTHVAGIGAFFIRYRSDGSVVLIKTSAGEQRDTFNDIHCDNDNGDCFIAGSFTHNITFDSNTWESTDDNEHAILIKVTIDGLWRDALVATGGSSYMTNVCSNKQDAYFGGSFDRQVELGGFNITSPSFISAFYGKWRRTDA